MLAIYSERKQKCRGSCKTDQLTTNKGGGGLIAQVSGINTIGSQSSPVVLLSTAIVQVFGIGMDSDDEAATAELEAKKLEID